MTGFNSLTCSPSSKCLCQRFLKPLVSKSSRKAISHICSIPSTIPNKQYYMLETMSVSGRKDFDKWHAQQVSYQVHFDFSKELVEYCESDIKLLKTGCLKFKALLEEKSKSNLFDRMTIASACNQDLRQNRMLPNTIASEPLHGWRISSNYSKVA